MSFKLDYYQRYFSPNNYMFWFRLDKKQNLRLKIFDNNADLIYKRVFSNAEIDLENIRKNLSKRNFVAIIATLRQKPELSDFFPNCKTEFMGDLQHLINQTHMNIAQNNPGLTTYKCAQTSQVFFQPMFDKTTQKNYEKKVVKHVDQLTINSQLQRYIIQVQLSNLIPTFHVFEKKDEDSYQAYKQAIERYRDDNDIDKAISEYYLALKHTNDWRNYQGLVELYAQKQDTEHLALACLYLAQYQLQDNHILEAIDTLTKYKKHFEVRQFTSLLIKLFLSAAKEHQVTEKALNFIEQFMKNYPREIPWLSEEIFKIKLTEDNQFILLALATKINKQLDKILENTKSIITQVVT